MLFSEKWVHPSPPGSGTMRGGMQVLNMKIMKFGSGDPHGPSWTPKWSVLTIFFRYIFRGAIKINLRKNLGNIPNWGEGLKNKQKVPNFNLGIFKTQEGVSIFQK